MNIRGKSRVGLFHPSDFWNLADQSVKEWQRLDIKIEALKSKGTFNHEGTVEYIEFHELGILKEQFRQETIKSILFLTCYLEAYFFEFAAITLGQSYATKHIERMELKSKIVVVTKLVTGQELDTGLEFWEGITKLISWRNQIAHTKTKDGFEYADTMIKIAKKKILSEELTDAEKKFDLGYDYPKVSSYYESIKGLLTELNNLDPEGLHTFDFNKKDFE